VENIPSQKSLVVITVQLAVHVKMQSFKILSVRENLYVLVKQELILRRLVIIGFQGKV